MEGRGLKKKSKTQKISHQGWRPLLLHTNLASRIRCLTVLGIYSENIMAFSINCWMVISRVKLQALHRERTSFG